MKVHVKLMDQLVIKNTPAANHYSHGNKFKHR